jgi:uncharacterized protein YoxC
MTNEELNAKLNALRGDVANKSRTYAAALKGLDDVLRALKDPTKNAAALVARLCAGLEGRRLSEVRDARRIARFCELL